MAYTLPDDTEHKSEDFEIPVAKVSGVSIPIEWSGNESGHEIAVNETSLREIAKKPRVTFTITREAPFITPETAGTGDGGNAPEPIEPAEPTRGEPIVSTIEVDLVKLILGSRRTCVLELGEGDGDTYDTTGTPTLPIPPALSGFQRVTFTVSLDPTNGETNDSGATAESTQTSKFLPLGLARRMEPFAVSIETAARLPDQPASRSDLSNCEPVTARVRWAGLPVGTLEASYGLEEWRPVGAESSFDHSTSTSTSTELSKKPRAYATKKGLGTSDTSVLHTRVVSFFKSVMYLGMDVPVDTYPKSLQDACANQKIEVRVYDRYAPNAPEPFPVNDSKENEQDEDTEETPAETSTPPEEEDEETRAARDLAEKQALCQFPSLDAYGSALFDMRDFATENKAPSKPFPKISLEQQLVPAAMSQVVGASWRTRPGRFLEAMSTVSITVTMAVHPAESAMRRVEAVAETKAEMEVEPAEEGAEETAETAAPEGEEKDTEESFTKDETEDKTLLPFVRAACTFPSDDLRFLRSVLSAVRRVNGEFLRQVKNKTFSDDTVLFDDARCRFFLASEKLTEPQVVDPNFHLVTGYHLVDGDVRQITVEGTRQAVEPVSALFAEKRRENIEESFADKHVPSVWTVMNDALGYKTRLYHSFGLDIRGIRLRTSIQNINNSPKTHLAKHLVRDETRECLRRVSELGRPGTRARQVFDLDLFPEAELLVVLDRGFGIALEIDDIAAETPGDRRVVERSATRVDTTSEGKHPSLDVTLETTDSFRTNRGSSPRTVHPPITTENSAYLAELARKRTARATQKLHAVQIQTVNSLQRTIGSERRALWSTWNVERPPRTEFETELETARRHPTASQKPAPRPAPMWGTPHVDEFKWPVAHVASERRVPELKRLPQSRIDELNEPWTEPESNNFSTKYFASKYFPGGVLDLTKDLTKQRRGGEGVLQKTSSKQPFSTFVHPPALFGEKPENTTVWVNSLEDIDKNEKDKNALQQKQWRDATAPRLKHPAQTDKTRGVLHDKAVKKGLTGKYVKGAVTPAPHSMFLEEPPVDLHGMSIDETFSRSLCREVEVGNIFDLNEHERELSLSAKFTGKGDFIRHNVGSRSLKHSGRKQGGVGGVARAADKRRSKGLG